MLQAALTVRLYHTDNVRNRLDTEAAERICGELNNADPSLPVVFHGKLAIDGESVLTEKTDVFGRSFFEWVYEDSRPSSATGSALRFIAAYSGKKYTALPDGPVMDLAMEEAVSAPCYPEAGFIRKTEQYILVNLSDPFRDPDIVTD